MKHFKILILVLSLVFLLVTPHSVDAQSSTPPKNTIAEAQVLNVHDTGKKNPQNQASIRDVKLKILSGPSKDKIFVIKDNEIPLAFQVNYKQGDHVIVTISDDGRGNNTVFISDYDRKSTLLLLFGIFIALIIVVARRQGVMSILGMLISFYVIAQVIIPSILLGTNAFTITIIGAFFIIPITYYLAHGLNKKTTIAIAGTFITLLLVAVLSYVFSTMARLTGSTEETVFLQGIYGQNINILSLLIAGMLIGALAVLNDITISQASVVASLRKSNRNLTVRQLYDHAMDVGKDHVASLVNTLIMVYVGASLPLVLLFYNTQTSLPLLLNQEIIATELIRTFVTSIGIVAAVPITTYLACLFTDR